MILLFCLLELKGTSSLKQLFVFSRKTFYFQSMSKSLILFAECEKEPGSLMWVFVLVGNIIRGMGETPIMPLGISYVEDFAKAENSPLYIGKSASIWSYVKHKKCS